MCLISFKKIHTSFFLISNSVPISPPSVKMRTGLWGYMYRIIPCTEAESLDEIEGLYAYKKRITPLLYAYYTKVIRLGPMFKIHLFLDIWRKQI